MKPPEHAEHELIEEAAELAFGDDIEDGDGEGLSRDFTKLVFNRKAMIGAGIFVATAVAFMYVVLPQLPQLQESIQRVRNDGDRQWLAAALTFELLSYAAYIWLFRAVFVTRAPIIGWRGSYLISMAGVAATRLFGAAGAGGVALTFWAVRRAGMGRREAVRQEVALLVLVYAVFMVTLVAGGVLLRAGIVPGNAPFSVTVIPAIFAGTVIVFFLLALVMPGNLESMVARWSQGRGRTAKLAHKFVAAPALISLGTKEALRLIREGHIGLLGAIGWWAFDIGVLWASFKAFGEPPPVAVLVMGYFVGMIFNLLPVPGGVGAVEGGMVAAYAAFGVDTGLAFLAVITYRVFAFWLPTIPGTVAFIRLRRKVDWWQLQDGTIESKAMPT